MNNTIFEEGKTATSEYQAWMEAYNNAQTKVTQTFYDYNREKKIEQGYISEHGKPLKCECGCTDFKEVNQQYGDRSIEEYSLECKNEDCLKIVGHWAYGSWSESSYVNKVMIEKIKMIDSTSNDFFQNFRSNPTNSFINHRDIYSLLMAKLPKEDKLKALNDMVKPEIPFTELKGWDKANVIDKIVQPIINNSTVGEIMKFKADINAMKDLGDQKHQNFVKGTKGEIKFIETSVSPKEYLQMLINNRDTIINGEKNKESISPAMLMLAFHENNNAKKFSELLEASGVSPERAKEFVSADIFTEHNIETNKIKKLVARDINADIKNVNIFKKATQMEPTLNMQKNESKNTRSGKR